MICVCVCARACMYVCVCFGYSTVHYFQCWDLAAFSCVFSGIATDGFARLLICQPAFSLFRHHRNGQKIDRCLCFAFLENKSDHFYYCVSIYSLLVRTPFVFSAFPERNSSLRCWWILFLISNSARKWNRFRLLSSAGMKACHDEMRLCHMTLFDVYGNSTHLLCCLLPLGSLFRLPACLPVCFSFCTSMPCFCIIVECKNLQKKELWCRLWYWK